MAKYKLAIFDLDGVLTETSQQHYLAWKMLADDLGLFFDIEMNEQLKGVSRMASFEVILRENDQLDLYGEKEKTRLITRKNDLYQEMIADVSPDNLFEGVTDLFTQLKSEGIKIGLASASHNGPALLESMNIAEMFDVVVNPGEVAQGKPAPDIFLAAAKKLGVEPVDCIGFEDAVAGVAAIKDAGMFAVGIGDPQILTRSDVVFHHIKDFDYRLLNK